MVFSRQEAIKTFIIFETSNMHLWEGDVFSLLPQRIAFAYLVVAVIEIATKDANIQDQSSSGFSIFRMYFSQWYVPHRKALLPSKLGKVADFHIVILSFVYLQGLSHVAYF